MQTDKFGQLIFSEDDLCNFVLQGHDPQLLNGALVDATINLDSVIHVLDQVPHYVAYPESYNNVSITEFDQANQDIWHMPNEYQELDIAAYILSLCNSDAALQRAGHELLLYQERNLFSLLKYLKYLVDIMKHNNIIWGVGRGSSVASYVLFLIGIHKIDSLAYDLDPAEFLR